MVNLEKCDLLESLYGQASEGVLIRKADNSIMYMNTMWRSVAEKITHLECWLSSQTTVSLGRNVQKQVLCARDKEQASYFEISARCIRLPEDMDAVFFSLRDVTEQEKNLRMLGACQANLTGLINNPADYIWTIDEKYRMTLTNDSFLAAYRKKYQIDISPGDSAFEIVHPHLSGQWRELYKRALDGERIVETHSVLEDGEWKWFDVFLHPIYCQESIAGAAVFLRDITTQRQTERRIYQLRQMYDFIIETSQVWIVAQDREGRVVLWNKGAEAISGYDRDEVMGRREVLEWLFPDPAYRKYVYRQFEDVAQGEVRENLYIKIRNRYGATRTLAVNAKRILDENGDFEGLYHIAFDITEQQRQAELLKDQAYTDPLTGVMNRRAGLAALERLLQKNERKPLSIIYLDMNKLKEINDTYGHQEGDAAIIMVANTLRETVRQTDIVCRLGGDEFMVAFEGARRKDVKGILNKVERKLHEYSGLQAKGYNVSVSAGIWEYTPTEQNLGAEELLGRADQEMYKQKRASRESLES